MLSVMKISNTSFHKKSATSASAIVASAPGKVILFGEHAVVYGEPSLVAAIDKRVRVRVERKRGDTRIHSNLRIADDFRYVKRAVELAFDFFDERCALDIDIKSEIPVAAGLGSSASVSVATILAVSKLLEMDISKNELAELGHRTELDVQGAASPTDTAIATFGGVLYIQPKKKKFTRIDASLPLIIGCTGIERSTKVLVENVRALRNKHAAVIDPLIKDIGKITREAKKRLQRGEEVGELMNVNHALLEALGVGHARLTEAVRAARNAGAKGAKLTGAGGGGCIIAYAPKNQRKVMNAIAASGCSVMKAAIAKEGARVEKFDE